MATCEHFTAWSHNPAQRQVCGAKATRVQTVQRPFRHREGGEQRIPLCQEHYESAGKVLVTG